MTNCKRNQKQLYRQMITNEQISNHKKEKHPKHKYRICMGHETVSGLEWHCTIARCYCEISTLKILTWQSCLRTLPTSFSFRDRGHGDLCGKQQPNGSKGSKAKLLAHVQHVLTHFGNSTAKSQAWVGLKRPYILISYPLMNLWYRDEQKYLWWTVKMIRIPLLEKGESWWSWWSLLPAGR